MTSEQCVKDVAYEWFVRGFMTAGEGWNGEYPNLTENEWRNNGPFNEAFKEAFNEQWNGETDE